MVTSSTPWSRSRVAVEWRRDATLSRDSRAATCDEKSPSGCNGEGDGGHIRVGGQMDSMIEEQFTAMYRCHRVAVERYVLRRVQAEVVGDVLAEVFLTAWRRYEQIPADPLPWLYGVARRVLANDRRAARRRRDLRVISFGESAVADEGAGDAGEGEEVVGFAFVAAVESAAAGEPGHGAFHGHRWRPSRWEDSIPLRAMRWVMPRSRNHRRRWA